MSEADLSLKGLEGFTGTMRYYDVMGVNITDGVKYVMDNGYGWLITDFICVAKFSNKLKGQEFVTVKLELQENDTAEMIVTDGNDKVLYRQKYEWTDAKKNIQMFFTNNVLMVSSEY